ncbi:MAG: hypothetical protein M1823_007241, partial [Watsoniomyces obsoletus]
MDEKLPRSYNNSQLELPQAVLYGSSRNSSRAPSSSFDRAVSAERVPNESRSSSPGRGQAPVRCGNCNHHVPQNSTALKALESPRSAAPSGPPSPRADTHARSGGSSNKSSRRTSDESDYMAIQQDVRSYETAYIRPPSIPVAVDPRTDLDPRDIADGDDGAAGIGLQDDAAELVRRLQLALRRHGEVHLRARHGRQVAEL